METFERQADSAGIRAEVARRIRSGLTQNTGAISRRGVKAPDAAVLEQLNTAADGLASASSAAGKLPPTPPTLRGRVGAVLVQAVNRALFWYTPQIHAFQRLVAQYAKQQAAAFGNLARQFGDTGRELRDSVENVAREVQVVRESSIHPGRIADLEVSVSERFDEIQKSLFQRIDDIQKTGSERLDKLERSVMHLQAAVTAQERRVSLLLEEIRRTRSTETLPEAAGMPAQSPDALYVSFEDAFRGTRDQIRDKLQVYITRLEEIGRDTANPVLDLGCGRGEWLELLAENGFRARGIDSNRSMVEGCVKRSLDAVEGDVVTYLRSLPDNSIGAVTGFHIVEHLPFDVLITMFDEAVRVLKPGGVAIFETPNPGNILVGSYYFHLDPTHRNPIPSETLQFFGESRGFCRTETLPLNPWPAGLRIKNTQEAIDRLNHYLYGPQDYAFIGVKPQ